MSVNSRLIVVLVPLLASVFDGSIAAWNCTLNITQRDGREIPNKHCLEYHLTSSECSGLNQDLPIPDNDLSVDPPINMEMTTTRVGVNESSKIVYGTQIELSWGPPQSGLALRYLKGFMVNCVSITGPDCGKCVMFDLQGSNFTIQDKDLVFNWKQEPLLPESSMSIQMELTALPRASVNRQALAQATAVPQKGTTEVEYPSYWRVPMIVKVKDDNVTLTFDYPKPEFIFNHFDVRLIQGRNIIQETRLAVYKHQTKGTHVFTNIPAGNFTVQVEPVDEYQNDEEKCLCYRGIFEGEDYYERDCSTCIISQVHITVLAAPPPTTMRSTSSQTPSQTPSTGQQTSSTPSTSHTPTGDAGMEHGGTPSVGEVMKDTTGASDTEIALAIVGTLLFVAVLLAAIFIMKNKKKKKCFAYESNRPTNFPNGSEKADGIYTVISEANPPTPKKTVLVLSADDHIHHLTAVKSLVSYLQEVARCRVIFPPYCLTEGSKNWKDWMFKCLDTANFVIIVNSQALYYIMNANKRHEVYKYRQLTDTGHMIVDFIQEVEKDAKQVDASNKFIHVSFDHTPQEFQLEDPVTRNSYRITETMDLLVKHIQKPPPGHQLHPYFVGVLTQNIEDTPAGKELKEAVSKAARFEKSDVLWFSDRFGHAYGRDCVRSDSGFDSLPVEADSPSTNLLFERMEMINKLSDEDNLYPLTDDNGDIINSDNHDDQYFNFLPPDVVSTSTNQPSIFIPPQTLSELESQSLSPSALIRNINQQSAVREDEEENEYFPYFSRC